MALLFLLPENRLHLTEARAMLDRTPDKPPHKLSLKAPMARTCSQSQCDIPRSEGKLFQDIYILFIFVSLVLRTCLTT